MLNLALLTLTGNYLLGSYLVGSNRKTDCHLLARVERVPLKNTAQVFIKQFSCPQKPFFFSTRLLRRGLYENC